MIVVLGTFNGYSAHEDPVCVLPGSLVARVNMGTRTAHRKAIPVMAKGGSNFLIGVSIDYRVTDPIRHAIATGMGKSGGDALVLESIQEAIKLGSQIAAFMISAENFTLFLDNPVQRQAFLVNVNEILKNSGLKAEKGYLMGPPQYTGSLYDEIRSNRIEH